MAPTILVADPDQTSLELITAVLTRDGFVVLSTPDGGDALSRCLEDPPALVLCAEKLPVVGAAQLCKQLKSQASGTRVVLLTDAGTPATLAQELGCDGVVVRPFRYDALREVLTRLGLAAPQAAPAPVVSFSVPVPEPLDFSLEAIAPAPIDTVQTDALPVPMALPLPIEFDAQPKAVREVLPSILELASPEPKDTKPAAVADTPSILDLASENPAKSEAPPKSVFEVDTSVDLEANARAARAEQEFGDAKKPPIDDVLAAMTMPTASPAPATTPFEEGALDLDAIAATPSASTSRDTVRLEPVVPNDRRPTVRMDAVAEATPAERRPTVRIAEPVAASEGRRDTLREPGVVDAKGEELPELELDDLVVEAKPAAAPPPANLPASSAPAQAVAKPAALAVPLAQPATRRAAPKLAALPPSLPRHGDLTSMPLPRLVFELYVATFSGVLALSRHGVRRSIYFWGGLPVRVDSEQIAESLARLLVEHGRITEEQYDGVLEAMRSGQSETDALVESAGLRKAEILDAMREQTEQRLVNTFAWRDGTYGIEANTDFADTSVLSEVHPVRAIWRGVSEHYDLSSLLVYFAGLRDRFAVATELFAVHFESIGPLLRNLDVGRLLDGKTTFERALKSDDTRGMELAQALYVLLVTDMVRPAQQPGQAVAMPERQTARQATAPADYREITRVCDEVAREYMRVKDCDYFDALRIEPDSPPEDVDGAYVNNVRAFLPETLPAGLPEDTQRRAQEICAVLARARSIARDPVLKERYIAAQRARFAPEEPDPEQSRATVRMAPVMDTTELELNPTASQDREAQQHGARAYAEGQRLLKAGNVALARDKFEVALRLSPRDPSYLVAVAQALRLEKPDDLKVQRVAASRLQEALQLDPANLEANFEMGRLLAGVGQKDAAKSFLSRVLQRSPEHREARALISKLG